MVVALYLKVINLRLFERGPTFKVKVLDFYDIQLFILNQKYIELVNIGNKRFLRLYTYLCFVIYHIISDKEMILNCDNNLKLVTYLDFLKSLPPK